MTREKVIRLLRQFIHQFDGRDVEDEFVEDVLESAADMLEQDAKTGWISVKDRLPEHGKQVLLIAYAWSDTTIYLGRLEHMSSETSWLTGFTSKESEWCLQGWSYLKEPLVTHWMPLPEPPEEGK